MSLQDELNFYDQVKTHYAENVYSKMVKAAQQIERHLEAFLKDKLDLRNTTSVNNSPRYRIHSRAKEADSLREKLVRSNTGFALLELRDELVLDRKLCLLPDIVGVKIITDLNVDADQVMDHIRRDPFLGQPEGTFELIDLASQPQRMRNGKKIYRMKGIFKLDDLTIGFELQVKSKLSDSWSELEHPWFYKNSHYSPMRVVLHNGMEFVESLLTQVDKQLEQLRFHTEKDISQYERIPFHIGLSRAYEDRLATLFGHPFSLIELQHLLECCAEALSEQDIDILSIVSSMSPSNTLNLDVDPTENASRFMKALDLSYQLRTVWAILGDWLKQDATRQLELEIGALLLSGLGVQARVISQNIVDQKTAEAGYRKIVDARLAVCLLPIAFNPTRLAFSCRLSELLSAQLMGLDEQITAFAVSTIIVTTSSYEAPGFIRGLVIDRDNLVELKESLQHMVQLEIWVEDPEEGSGHLPNWLKDRIRDTCSHLLDAR